jgi:tetratricopeptide (TPR) repeat protein
VLVASWLRRTGAEKDEAIARGRKWLETRVERRPASPALWAGMTALLTGSGKAAEAEAALRAALEKGGGPDISRLLERVLRAELGRGAEAGEMALNRLQGRTRTPGEAIELAETYTHLERTADAAAALREGLPPDVALSGKQEFQVLALAMEAAKRAGEGANAATRGPAVEILDLAAARGLVLPPDLHERRLVLLAATPEADVDRLLDAAALTGRQHEKLVDAGYVVMSQALGAAGRDAVEIAFISRAAAARPTADVFAEWFRVIADVGRAAHARDLVAAAGSAGKLGDLFQKLGGEAAPAWDVRAEIVYALGTFFAGKQKDDEAAAAYELALEYEPGHPWACNNLGYMLADKGVQLERAAGLLERAHAALPQEASIADSLGWLRYKQGIIEDRVDPATGAVQVRGAVTLLRGAVESGRDGGNAVHLDHLGDALWLAGNREEAQRCWQRAESLASQEIRASERAAQSRGNASGRQLSPAALQAHRALREAARAKRRAAAAGQTVLVAPQIGRAGVPEPAKPAPGPDHPSGVPAGQPSDPPGGPGF